MLTIPEFQKKYKHLIDLGVCKVKIEGSYIEIVLNRFIDDEFVCTYDKLKPAQADVRKMGFERVTLGVYVNDLRQGFVNLIDSMVDTMPIDQQQLVRDGGKEYNSIIDYLVKSKREVNS